MRTTHTFTFFAQFLLMLSLMSGSALFAQETDESSSKGLTQGQAAIVLVRRLGLWANDATVLTQNAAIAKLESMNVAPHGGWEEGAVLSNNDLARMLAQVLGLDQDFSDDQKADPDATAHKEALIAQHNLNIDQLVSNLASNKTGIPSGTNNPDSTETDPVIKPILPETDDFVPNNEVLGSILDVITQVTSPTQNITPSAP